MINNEHITKMSLTIQVCFFTEKKKTVFQEGRLRTKESLFKIAYETAQLWQKPRLLSTCYLCSLCKVLGNTKQKCV